MTLRVGQTSLSFLIPLRKKSGKLLVINAQKSGKRTSPFSAQL